MNEHFEGKSAKEHLIAARLKGKKVVHEVHGTELAGHKAAFTDAVRETSLYLLFLWVLSQFFPLTMPLFALFATALLIWKVGRSVLLGRARLDRLHRLIEEERWEIEHHRKQEREELTEMYRAKGLEGKLLEQVIDTLMADDNRLLGVMLEEELGLKLESYEHPLKQAFGALFGVTIPSIILIVANAFLPKYGIPLFGGILIAIVSYLSMKLEKSETLTPVIWSLATAAVSGGALYCLCRVFL